MRMRAAAAALASMGILGLAVTSGTGATHTRAAMPVRATPFCISADTHAVLLRTCLRGLVRDTTGAGVTLRDRLRVPAADVAKRQALYAARYDGSVNAPGDRAGEWRVIELYDATTLSPGARALAW